MIINKNLMQILYLLNSKGPMCVYEMTQRMKLSQPLISKRLRILRDLKLVVVKNKDNLNRVFYDINPKHKDSAVFHLIKAYEDLL